LPALNSIGTVVTAPQQKYDDLLSIPDSDDSSVLNTVIDMGKPLKEMYQEEIAKAQHDAFTLVTPASASL
jgi:hypothetical protein